MAKVTITLTLDPETIAIIEARAKAERRSRSSATDLLVIEAAERRRIRNTRRPELAQATTG